FPLAGAESPGGEEGDLARLRREGEGTGLRGDGRADLSRSRAVQRRCPEIADVEIFGDRAIVGVRRVEQERHRAARDFQLTRDAVRELAPGRLVLAGEEAEQDGYGRSSSEHVSG